MRLTLFNTATHHELLVRDHAKACGRAGEGGGHGSAAHLTQSDSSALVLLRKTQPPGHTSPIRDGLQCRIGQQRAVLRGGVEMQRSLGRLLELLPFIG